MNDENQPLRPASRDTAAHSRLIWILLAVWLAYSGGVLWKLAEASPWSASMCVVPR